MRGVQARQFQKGNIAFLSGSLGREVRQQKGEKEELKRHSSLQISWISEGDAVDQLTIHLPPRNNGRQRRGHLDRLKGLDDLRLFPANSCRKEDRNDSDRVGGNRCESSDGSIHRNDGRPLGRKRSLLGRGCVCFLPGDERRIRHLRRQDRRSLRLLLRSHPGELGTIRLAAHCGSDGDGPSAKRISQPWKRPPAKGSLWRLHGRS